KGNAAAMTRLGHLYSDGKGVEKDYVAARNWYLKATERGDDMAMLCLALMYREGWGVERDEKQARQWLRRAAVKGNSTAIQILLQLGEPVPKGAAQPFPK